MYHYVLTVMSVYYVSLCINGYVCLYYLLFVLRGPFEPLHQPDFACHLSIYQIWVKTSFELPLGRRSCPRNIIPETVTLELPDRLFYNPILRNVCPQTVGNLNCFPSCVTVTHLILELWTVLNSHGIEEQALVSLCPKQKNWRCQTSFSMTPHSKISVCRLWVIWLFPTPV